MDDARNQALGIWSNLSLGQRLSIAAVGLAAIVAIAAMIFWANTPNYGTLFSNLSEEDAAAIVAKLKESKISYELAKGGSTILVPASILYETRLQMASAGLPLGGGVGFEIFGQTNFGMTDFAQKINYQRALEGELSRTINRLAPVEQSRVHVVIPQPTLYTDNQKEPSGSVVLKLKPGQKLKESQIHGIAQLVSSSVEGLKPENLTIVDSNGSILSDALAGGKEPGKISSSQFDSQRALESNLEQKAQGMLDKVLGNGRATVRVRAALDWDQVESSSETYSPSNTQPQLRSQREISESYGLSASAVGGVPGTSSNIPGYAGIVTDTTTAQGPIAKKDTTVNYELSKTVEKTTRATGSIKKLSVAVVLDASETATTAQIDEVSKLVAAAVGIDRERGDVLEVSSIPYQKESFTTDVKSMEEAQQWEKNVELGKIGAMAVGPVLLLLFLFFATRRKRSVDVYSVKQLSGMSQREIAETLPVASIPAAEQKPARSVASLIHEDPQHKQVREQVTQLARTRPDTMASLLKTWLQDESEYDVVTRGR
ncbi:MAG: flagellar M-ring protein FliF [Chloroflexi bacterium]|nr:flagellar M-ring protein FliF [Chloroflexota bacterium]